MTHWYKILADGEIIDTLPSNKVLYTMQKRKTLKSYIKDTTLQSISGLEIKLI